MTPSLEHAIRLLPRARWRWPAHLPFGRVMAVSALLHAVAFGVVASLAGSPPREALTVYTVRVVDAPAGAGARKPVATSRAPASQSPAPAPQVPVKQVAARTPIPADAPSPPLAVPTPPALKAAPEPVGESADAQPPAVEAGGSPADAAPEPDAIAAAAAVAPPAPENGGGDSVPAVDAETLDPGFGLAGPLALHYPDAARRARKAGRVRLEVTVGPDGRVLGVRVLEATPGWGFAEAARAAYAAARFSPPRWQGRPVRVLWRKTLLFRP